MSTKRLVFAYAGPISGLSKAIAEAMKEGIQWDKEKAGVKDTDKNGR